MSRHTALRLSSAALGFALVGGSAVAFAGAAQADPNPNITICHATNSASNPFVVNTVDGAAIIKQGHHQHQDQRDVIPPFSYVVKKTGKTKTFGGLNWNNNWPIEVGGAATGPVDKSQCSPRPTQTPTPTSTNTPTPTSTNTPTSTPTPTVTVTSTPTPTSTSTPTTPGTPTPTTTPTTPGTSTPTMTPTTPGTPNPTPTRTAPSPTPTGPVVETDIVDSGSGNAALLGGGAALLLAGAGAMTVIARRRGLHS